jgi:hypothetical protein
MKKLFFAIVAMVMIVSCGGNKYDQAAAIYKDATEAVKVAKSKDEIKQIDAKLEADIAAFLLENKEEFKADMEIRLKGSDEEADAIRAEDDKVDEAKKAYRKAKRERRKQL